MHIQPDQNPAPEFVPVRPYEEHLWGVVLVGLHELIETFVHVAPNEEARQVAVSRAQITTSRLHDFVDRLEQISGNGLLPALSNTIYTADMLVEELVEINSNVAFAVVSNHIASASLVMASEIKEQLGIAEE